MSCNIKAIIYRWILPGFTSFFVTHGGEDCFAFSISPQEPHIEQLEQAQFSHEKDDTLKSEYKWNN